MGGVSVREVSKEYVQNGRRVVAVSNVSLDIKDGEFVCVVGHSGCGKTTLLNILAGFLEPTSGSIVFGDSGGAGGGDIGVVFQEYALFPWRTAAGNVEFGLEMRDVPPKERRLKARQFLDLVHLGHVAQTYPHQLSGGMRQRVAVARALAYDPALLLMDEPFGALDAMTRDELNFELQRTWLASGKTVVFITHSIAEAVYLGDRVIVMSRNPGRVAEDIRVDLERPRGLAVRETPRFGDYVAHIRETPGFGDYVAHIRGTFAGLGVFKGK
jgi:NitT/TauT family transport system ATP-binding protein